MHHAFRSMASDVTFDIAGPRIDLTQKVNEANGIFRAIETSCTRFDAKSPLMLANANPTAWNALPPIAIEVIKAAYGAYQLTDGVFDPRILKDLVENGYDENLHFEESVEIRNENVEAPTLRHREEWRPEFRTNEVKLGSLPIDLGGIGKGFAVQSAMEVLQDFADGVLINAGGDIAAEGFNEEERWRIGIENPWDAAGEPVLVVELEDASIATSSIRLRSWLHEGHKTHHLIDPSTGKPGGQGLVAVSAISLTTSLAEVWSKTLFLKGISGIEEFAERQGIAAAWIDESANVFLNEAFQKVTIWGVAQAPNLK